jgi:hypothetical protein
VSIDQYALGNTWQSGPFEKSTKMPPCSPKGGQARQLGEASDARQQVSLVVVQRVQPDAPLQSCKVMG